MKHGKHKKRRQKAASGKVKRGLSGRALVLASAGILIAALLGIFAWKYFFAKPAFDGRRAFAYLQQQCDFGPRAPGSEAHRRCGDFLAAELGKFADKVWEQRFDYRDKKDSTRVYRGRNIVASFNLKPAKGFRVMLCAHWDTRPWADKDPDPANRLLPVPGANDGASGTAALLEMARVLHGRRPDFGVDIVLFDLEDLGDYHAEAFPDSLNPFCIGSEHFAASRGDYRPRYGILLDMVGDSDLVIKKEAISRAQAPQLMERVWAAARRAGAGAFVDAIGPALQDDHVPFLKRGIPVINVVDFDYPYWHTVSDTPDKCSPASLQQVGEMLVEMIYGGK